MRHIRRKQFFAFFEGFFERHTNESTKLKTHEIQFSEEEKQKMLKRYFKKYFNEKVEVNKSSVEKSLEQSYGISSMMYEKPSK